MPKHAVTFLELHNPLFMQGSNLGNKMNAVQKGLKIAKDDERSGVWVYFKGKTAFLPDAAVASMDLAEIPADVLEHFAIETAPAEFKGPPAIARARREGARVSDSPQAHDPNDPLSESEHVASVRAMSAGSHVAAPQVSSQNDALIQAARAQVMASRTAQVANPTQPTQGASVSGKPKALSHAALKAQIAAEAKGP